MSANNLPVLLRLRQQAADDARRLLATCIQKEMETTDAVRSHASAIDRERHAVESLDVDDVAVEAFGVWLRTAREQLSLLTADVERAALQTARARAELAAARAAQEAVEILLREGQAREIERARKVQQSEIDDWTTTR